MTDVQVVLVRLIFLNQGSIAIEWTSFLSNALDRQIKCNLFDSDLFLGYIVTCIVTFYLQFAIFGSILTIGAMIGAVTSGRLADFLGRKMVKLLPCQLGRFASVTEDRLSVSPLH